MSGSKAAEGGGGEEEKLVRTHASSAPLTVDASGRCAQEWVALVERTVADADRARSMVAKLREPEFGVSSAETLKRLKKDDLMAAGFSRGEANVLIEKLGGRDARAAVCFAGACSLLVCSSSVAPPYGLCLSLTTFSFGGCYCQCRLPSTRLHLPVRW